MVFSWVVRHLRWLARIPGATHLFDGLLLAWTRLFHRQRLAAMAQLEAEVENVIGLELGVHRFGGTSFMLGKREIGHIHGNGLLDVRFSTLRATELIAAGRVGPHHFLPRSGWVSFQLESSHDATLAGEILREAVGGGSCE